MVTNLKEGAKIKCQEYWPTSGKKEEGPFQITITDQQIFADYTIRTFTLEVGTVSQSVPIALRIRNFLILRIGSSLKKGLEIRIQGAMLWCME